MGNEVMVVKPGSYAVTTPNAASFVQQGFESGVGAFDLTRVKVPAGGVTQWAIPGLGDEDTYTPQIDCVVALVQARQKAWWREGMDAGGGGQPPACSSTNGLIGNGNNRSDGKPEGDGAHECADCEWNQWDSARNGTGGKDCKDFARLYVFRPESRMPTLVTVPATSLKAMQKYVMKLMDAGRSISGVVTRLRLVKAKSGSGIEYSQIAFSYGGDLPEAEVEAMKEVGAVLRRNLATRTAAADAADVG